MRIHTNPKTITVSLYEEEASMLLEILSRYQKTPNLPEDTGNFAHSLKTALTEAHVNE